MKDFFVRHKFLSVVILLLIIVLFSYGKISQMYYWVDDWAMAYKVVFPQERLSNMEPGIFGAGAYRYLLTPYHLLFPIFGFNASAYFTIGLILYFLATCSVYLLAREITQKYLVAFSAAAIFASGYIGSHALFRLTNLYQTVGATLLICLTTMLFAKYLRGRKHFYYWLSLFLFTSTLEIVLIRSHGLFFSIMGLAITYWVSKATQLSIKSLLIRLLPFLAVFSYLYFLDPRIESGANLITDGVNSILQNPKLFGNFLITFSNTLIPDQVTSWLHRVILKVAGREIIKVDLFSIVMGGGFLLGFASLALSGWRTRKYEALLVVFSLIWVLANSIVFFIYAPTISLESTNRYLVPAFVGVGLLYSSALFLLAKKRLALSGVIIVCIILIYFSNKESDHILQNVTLPDKQGYSLIRQEVDKVDKNAVFYIETADDPKNKGNVLGNLPQYGLSALYEYKGVTTIADSYEHLYYLLTNESTSLENIHTYFFGKDGYKSTTSKVRNLLGSGGEHKTLDRWWANLPTQGSGQTVNTKTVFSSSQGGTLGVNPALESSVEYDSLVPSSLEFTLTLRSLSLANLAFPYRDVTKLYSNGVDISKIKPPDISIDSSQTVTVLRDESVIQEFRRLANIRATSSFKTTGENFLTDGDNNTNWGADATHWNASNPEDLIIDIGKFMNVKKLVWVNHHYMATPTVYIIYSSVDGTNWTKQLEVKNGPRKDGGAIVEEDFPSILYTRFLKIHIDKTFGGIGYPPAIDEMWVLNSEKSDDPKLREEVINCPACFILDSNSAEAISNLTESIATARIWWETDVRNGFTKEYSQEFPINMDGLPHTYKIILPAQGTKFKRFKIDGFQLPLDVTLSNASIRSLSLDEIKKANLIR